MKAFHRISEKSGMMGGQQFIVEYRVELDADEEELRSTYGFFSDIDVGERFKDIKDVGILGRIHLNQLMNRGLKVKFSKVQMASDFVDLVTLGLRGVKSQIVATKRSIEDLGKSYEVEISEGDEPIVEEEEPILEEDEPIVQED